MDKLEVFHIYHVAQFPIHVRYLVSQSSLKYVVLSDCFLFCFPNLKLECDLSPLILRQQMIALSVVPRLHEAQIFNVLVKRIRPLLFEQRLDVFEHGLAQGPLEDYLVAALVSIV